MMKSVLDQARQPVMRLVTRFDEESSSAHHERARAIRDMLQTEESPIMQLTIRKHTLAAAGALVAVILAGAVVLSAMDSNPTGGASAQEGDRTRTITVSGEGRVSLAPDTVMMTLGVDVRNEELDAAQTEAAEKMDAIIAALKGAGVAEQDIQTGSYYINVERDYNQPSQPLIGYIVSHTVTAKVRDTDKAGSTIEAAVDAGANNVGGVWFALENPSDAIKQAREQAVSDARARAEELARLSNATLGVVQHITEGYSNPVQPVPYANAEAGAAYDMATKSVAPTINPGQTEVVMSVTVTYAITS
jgi:uncharacterized protein YggE